MSRRPKRINLEDIAREAGVTVSTVSRILSKQTEGFSVKPDKRQRVLEAAERLQYRPNVLAQSLRKKQMGIVGLLSVQSPLGYLQSITSGMMRVFDEEGFVLSSTYSNEPHPNQVLPPWQIDGAIIVSAVSPQETEDLERAKIPYVCLNGAGGKNAMMVGYDDASGTREAIEYLVRLGHRRIAYANVSGPYNAHISVETRRGAYLAVLKENGLEPMPGHDLPRQEPHDDFVRQLVLERKATAIVTYHGHQALAMLQTLYRLGLRVPQHVSLLCLGGGYPLDYLYPSVTEVNLPFEESGSVAAQMLIDGIRNPREIPKPILLPEKLIIRQSTAPPMSELR